MNAGERPQRFTSVDVLRGWAVAAMLLVNYPGDWGSIYAPLEHAAWHGCTPTDLIFPTFLFVVGVSIALGMSRETASRAERRALLGKAWMRALRLVAIGMLLNLVAMWAYDIAAFRPWGVLQRIGLCFGLAATAVLYLRARPVVLHRRSAAGILGVARGRRQPGAMAQHRQPGGCVDARRACVQVRCRDRPGP